ncbi:hypothetical protein [Paenibacillus sp. An7]|uniref:hypothetical protein n=1 Tax=Paenibacillus sp. An7 TaxID=2689577 RepID=UPI00135AD47B|nr:hypothetical protein [Paenibacillus sp. An7]
MGKLYIILNLRYLKQAREIIASYISNDDCWTSGKKLRSINGRLAVALGIGYLGTGINLGGKRVKEVIKNSLLGMVVFIIGFAIIFVLTSSDIEAELTYYAAIAYALLYLASVISVCTAVILRKLLYQKNESLIELTKKH